MTLAIIKKLKQFCAVVFSLGVALSGFGAIAQSGNEVEAATESHFLQIMLPANAQRIVPQSIPAEVTQTLDKIIASGGGKVRKGEVEVLVWAGAGYKKANAAGIINRLAGSLKSGGWAYSVQGEENGVTLFSAVKDAPRRVVIGFHGATDDALIFAAMEILANNRAAANNQTDASNKDAEDSAVSSGSTSNGNIVGTWGKGMMSMIGEVPRVGAGSFTPKNSSTFKYVFHPNGTYEFIGYMESAQFGCTTSLFNDKRGKYTINGDQITLTPSKNFWRKQNSCAPNSNSERDYVLERESFTISVSRNDSGKQQICLADGKSETCYERK